MISEFCLFVESLRGTLPIFSLSSFIMTFTAALSESQLTFFFPSRNAKHISSTFFRQSCWPIHDIVIGFMVFICLWGNRCSFIPYVHNLLSSTCFSLIWVLKSLESYFGIGFLLLFKKLFCQ